MRKSVFGLVAVIALAVAGLMVRGQTSQRPQAPAVPSAGEVQPLPAVYPLDEAYLDWPLPETEKAYGAIDGKRLHRYVAEISAIGRRYRDQGHQFWGRITGTSADAETQQWVLDRFKQIGLSDVRTQTHDLPPQWLPQSWEVTAMGNGKTFRLESAQPVLMTPGTTSGGLDLEAVYVGTGSEADFAGRDVRGKAAIIYSVPQPSMWNNTAIREGATRRAEEKGAAAILIIQSLPGNNKTQLYPTQNRVPTIGLGLNDGLAVRDLIGQSLAGPPVRLKVRLDVQNVPNLKTATLWGTLPGRTAEKIYIVAHRDGMFDGATDNASGMATSIGLAEYFAKIPQAQRRRTIVFISTTGHHNNCTGGSNTCTISGQWIAEHHEELFKDTALIINSEHTATTQTYVYRGPSVRKANSTNEANFWYVGGSPRLVDTAAKAYRTFGVPTYAEPEPRPAGEMGAFFQFAPSLQVIDVGMFAHSDQETPDAVPWTGLAAVTRAYAKIINDVNALDIKDLLRPQSDASKR